MELQIKRIQEEKKISNLELAEMMGVSPQYVGQLAKGTVGATIEKYEQVANLLGVKLWQLFAPKEEYILTEKKYEKDEQKGDYNLPSQAAQPKQEPEQFENITARI